VIWRLFLGDSLSLVPGTTPGNSTRHHYRLGGLRQRVHFPAITTLTRVLKCDQRRWRRRCRRHYRCRTDVLAVFGLPKAPSSIRTSLGDVPLGAFGWRASARRPGQQSSPACSARRARGYLSAERQDHGEFIRVFLRRYSGSRVARWRTSSPVAIAKTLLPAPCPRLSRRASKEHRAARPSSTVLVTGSIRTLVTPLADLFR
jgi:hypothetical protein